MQESLDTLSAEFEGDLFSSETMRIAYATDASVYRQLPAAVCLPRTKSDIKQLINFANTQGLAIIPRTAGTSLAGQVVGSGIIVDVSKYWSKVIDLDILNRRVRVQPGIVRDELNQYLKPHGLMFAPETSTANRCMIGGMAGNNSCGTHSLIYGSTRDHVEAIDVILSDGTEARFQDISLDEAKAIAKSDSLEAKIYRDTLRILSASGVAEEIRREFPHREIHRRNTGYAIDIILNELETERINLAKLLCGSEGTLAFTTELTLKLVPLPPIEQAVVAIHLHSIPQAARATLVARESKARAIELIDHIILDCAKTNKEQLANRAFVEGEPSALLVVEFASDDKSEVEGATTKLIDNLKSQNLGYAYPIIWNDAINAVWALRNAGLGVMTNVPGDRKPVAGIEDTAIRPQDLPAFVDDFLDIMKKRQVEYVAYAHIGDGEIHFRPLLDLKLGKDRKYYREICEEVATLVKRFGGSLSGEHGDGRARAEFIRQMIGEKNYMLCRAVKQIWDPEGIFNPGKIVDAPKIDTDLRYDSDQLTNEFVTVFDFSDTQGILRMAEKCNGTGACRKTEKIGGTMCPSYMATRSEQHTTRARANVLREFLTRSTKENKFDHKEILEVMDLCLSCKGCSSECPSNVDIARLKAEFLHQYYEANGIPFRSRLIGNIEMLYKLGSFVRPVSNFLISNRSFSKQLKKKLKIAEKRSLPLLSEITLRTWAKRNLPKLNPAPNVAKQTVYLFCDVYTNYSESEIGIAAIELLTALGYHVQIPKHVESGRAFFSKGLLKNAKRIANQNVRLLGNLVSNETPLLGIEPSAILGFRDEYPDIVDETLKKAAKTLAPHCLLIDEFLGSEIEKGRIATEQFTNEKASILLHGHCHQKALSMLSATEKLLSLPINYTVETIPSGCCGMAGSFGYEEERFDLSQQVGELVLFPAIRESVRETIIAAPGTSCRHQIKDGVERQAQHPVQILRDALIFGS